MVQNYSNLLIVFSMLYLFLGIYVFDKNRESSVNRAFFLLCISESIWAFGYAFMIHAGNIGEANFWRIIAAAGWCFFYGVWLDFTLQLYGKTRSIWNTLLLYMPGIIIFIYTMMLPKELVLSRLNGGWDDNYPLNLMEKFFILYFSTYILAGIAVIYLWGGKSRKRRENKQAMVIIAADILTIILSVLSEYSNVIFGVKTFSLTVIVLSVAMAGLLFAIKKYKLIDFMPKIVSEYLFKEVNTPIFLIDSDLRIKYANKEASSLTGYELDDLRGASFSRITDVNLLLLFEDKEEIEKCEINLISWEGKTLQFEMSGKFVYDEFREKIGILIILHDVYERKKAERILENYNIELKSAVRKRTAELEKANQVLKDEVAERKAAEAKIRSMGYYDHLTKLPNHRYFDEYITRYIEEIKDQSKMFAVLYLDLDNFKLINDTFGHQHGNGLLKHYTAELGRIITENCFFARVGGDEFLVLVKNIDPAGYQREISDFANKILDVFDNPYIISNTESFVTVSIGIAVYPMDGTDSQSMIKNADTAMYEAKNNGKNNFRFCSEEIKNKLLCKTRYRNLLYRAQEKQQFSLVYQPQVNIITKRITGVEVLVRWKLPNDALVPPTEFIPIAEETGLIVPIGYWIFKKACLDYKKLTELGFGELTLAVNISTVQLSQSYFADEVLKIISDIGIDPRKIEMEITERVTLEQSGESIENLDRIKKSGIRVSIDDFGTAYSSYMNIKHLPVDKIKIAKEFVNGINTNEKDAAIINSIIHLSHNLKLAVIAEGVETNNQLKFLIQRNCDEVQGFLFYRPMEFDALKSVLKSSSNGEPDTCMI
ncbi:MAG TPA: EAL domain-containing protein [Clostridia bacterium]|nr:EAL domain-containing protein [Clostridia bacterium]